ncbi:MAG: sigma-70 family RNA polymerase sigma factor, partial [Myxococcales bacterium]
MLNTMNITEPSTRRSLLGDPRLRSELVAMVRRRVPPGEVEDVVQATLTEALLATSAPEPLEELRRWVWGIARHKVADVHRKKRHVSDDDIPEPAAPGDGAREATDLLRWAERELPESEGARETLGWLLREGDGEKLEHIAEAERLPAPRVRQRVTRLRQHFRTRWQAQLAAVATLVGAVALFWWWLRPRAPEAP